MWPFGAVLFTIAKRGTTQVIKGEMCCIYTMKYYSAIKGMKHWHMLQHG